MDRFADNQKEAFKTKVVHVSRVAKVVKGGRRFSFSALVVSGDSKSQIGFGLGKAGEVPDAVRKGGDQCKKTLIDIPKVGGTIPFEVIGRYGSCKVLMYPAKKGRGIIAGGAVRLICELGGISDIVCKIHGTKNKQNVVRAVFNGLEQLVSLEDYAKGRGMTAGELADRVRGGGKQL